MMLRLVSFISSLLRVVALGAIGFLLPSIAAALGVPLQPGLGLPIACGIALALIELRWKPLARMVDRLGSPT